MYDIAIIGCGPIGSGAARHASRAGQRTCIIGPHEPARASHQVWSSHYDSGRLTHRSARNLQLALWANEALASYADIEHQSGIPFHVACGTLSISRDLRNFRYTAIRDELETQLGFRYEDFTPTSLITRFPMLNPSLGMTGIYDGAPSGYVDPRAMVRAQLTCAQQQGATLVCDIVTQLIPHDDHVVIQTQDGQTIHAAHAIVAAGAYSGLCGLLPTPVPHTIKTETVVLGEISATTAAELAGMPSMMVDCTSDVVSDAYLTPPICYPDGKWYIKLGSNSVHDVFVESLPQLQQWIRNDAMPAVHGAQVALLRELFPAIPFIGFKSVPCVITRSPSGVPQIIRSHARVTAVVGCNGALAKSGDVVGKHAVTASLA